MKKIDWKDVGARTVKTFIATFIGALSFGDVLFAIKDTEGLARYIAASLISAVSAAVTAVWNMLLELFGDKINELIDKVIAWIFKKTLSDDHNDDQTESAEEFDAVEYESEYEEDPADEGEDE